MKPVLVVYKPVGATPLEMVKKVKQTYPEYAQVKIGYAGRLDPMAEGLLLLLVGEENKNKLAYESLPKTYTIKILFGIETDTGDILGLVTNSQRIENLEALLTQASKIITALPGTHDQISPHYSARRYQGKPLYYWARRGLSPKTGQPKKRITIIETNIGDKRSIDAIDIETSVTRRIAQVSGNFRQEDILISWQQSLHALGNAAFPILGVTITCTSGTYMRAIAQSVGGSLGVPSLAWTIKRDKIGPYTSTDADPRIV